MDVNGQYLLVGSALVVLSILSALLSNRIGAPLLLVFLGIGMLAGVEGPGKIEFSDYQAANLLGSLALAVILFDGGLRTPRAVFLAAWKPSLVLATLGVFITSVIVGLAAWQLLGLDPLQSLLLGAIVSSTDAAAVFMALGGGGLRLKDRVSATLQGESGLNDPLAVFLTLLCVELIISDTERTWWTWAGILSWQLFGGLLFGALGGYLLLRLINGLRMSQGLYPILALSLAVLTFAAAQVFEASGFLAIYLAGLFLGNVPHQASQLVDRFHDGMAWLAQILLFLMLGLLVVPSHLITVGGAAIAIAAVLMLVGRPVAVLVSLLPFRYAFSERMFISWVGLKGAVPIFLGSIPVLAGVPNANLYFSIAFVIVLVSLLFQGWSIASVAKLLEVSEPGRETPGVSVETDIPGIADQDLAAISVEAGSFAEGNRLQDLRLGDTIAPIAIVRAGKTISAKAASRLTTGDILLAVVAENTSTDFLDQFSAGASPSSFGPLARDVSNDLSWLLSRLRMQPRLRMPLPGRVPLPSTLPLTTRAPAGLILIAALAIGWWIALPPPLPGLSSQRISSVGELRSRVSANGELGFVAKSLPPDWPTIVDTEERKKLFVATLLPIIRAQNQSIENDRDWLVRMSEKRRSGRRLTLNEQARKDRLHRDYGVEYADLDQLLTKLDIIPPPLAVAQAAVGSGWGTSRSAIEANLVFGRLSQPDNGARSYPDLFSAVVAYFDVLNKNAAHEAFRRRRAELRAMNAPITGTALAGALDRYAQDGDAYVEQVKAIIINNGLERLNKE